MAMKHTIFPFAVLMMACGAASAQAPPTPATPPAQTAPAAPGRANDCAPTSSTPHGNIAPQGTTVGQGNEPLGDKLARSDGVLCPPAGVDPAMRAPTPDSGNMPVLPPPGSPGGDPSVRPK
jgi:hypothetical protein